MMVTETSNCLLAEALTATVSALTTISETTADPWAGRTAEDGLHQAGVIMGSFDEDGNDFSRPGSLLEYLREGL